MSFRDVAMIFAAAVSLAGCQALPDVQGVPDRISRVSGVSSAIVFLGEGEAVDMESPRTGLLTAADAVRQALTHSPEIQAAMARVRQALADARQTRLLPNPLLSVAFRLPESGGSPTVEAALVADLVSLLRRPRQASAADARVRSAVAEMLGVVLDTVAETEERYTTAQALDAELAVLGERRAVVERLRGIAEARFRVGEAVRLDVLTLDAERAELALEIEGKEAAREDERLALARLLGQPTLSMEWTLSPWTAPGEAGSEGAWVEAALRHRPEIQARVWELAALGDEAALARYAFLEGNGGLSAERDGEWTVGPAIDIPLPIFDWGQARRDKADGQLMEARHRLVESRRKAVEEVRRAWAAVAAARRLIARAEGDLLPVQERRLAQAEAQYRNGQADVTAVLLAQQDAQAGRTRLVELQKNLALAQSRLYRAAGGVGVAPFQMTGSPTAAPGGLLQE